MKVKDKIAIVTGGAQGLGRGFAEGLLKNGASIVIADVKTDVGRQTETDLNNQYEGNRCTFIKCDVTDQDEFKNVFRKTKELHGNIDILVNNAGILDEQDRLRLIKINLISVIEGSYLALDYMRKDKGGRGGLIVNIASSAGVMEIPQNPVYAASKHGVVGLTRCLGARQEDVVGQGVRFCCLCPTLVRTPMIENVIDEVAWAIEKYGMLEVSTMVDVFLRVVGSDGLHASIVITTQTGAVVQFQTTSKAPNYDFFVVKINLNKPCI